MLRFKQGVWTEVQRDGQTITVSPQIWYALGVAETLWKDIAAADVVVTSLLDGTHMIGSLHYEGKAADLRCRDLTKVLRDAVFRYFSARLTGLGFQVIYEKGPGATPATTAEHIHVEYDPKPGDKFMEWTT